MSAHIQDCVQSCIAFSQCMSVFDFRSGVTRRTRTRVLKIPSGQSKSSKWSVLWACLNRVQHLCSRWLISGSFPITSEHVRRQATDNLVRRCPWSRHLRQMWKLVSSRVENGLSDSSKQTSENTSYMFVEKTVAADQNNFWSFLEAAGTSITHRAWSPQSTHGSRWIPTSGEPCTVFLILLPRSLFPSIAMIPMAHDL